MGGTRKRILLVDDSNTALMIEKMLLGKGPYDVTTAHDGSEGVARAVAEQPDLILMDIVMPKMTGLEACRFLRAQESTKAIPIILVSTRGEPDVVAEGFASGCSDYVTKPIDGLELLSKLRDLLGE